MRRILAILLAALCALLPMAALAENATTIKTTVPSSHTITINCGKNGSVVIDGKTYEGTFTIEAERLGTLVVKARPDSGYGLNEITADHLTGVTIKGRTVTLSNVYMENALTISFYKLPVTEDETGDETENEEETPTGTEPFEPMPDVEEPILDGPTLGDVVVLPDEEPTGNTLYDDYLGDGSGNGGGIYGPTSIVFDAEYLPKDYELLNVLIDDELQGNSMLVCALPNEEGETEQRSLILSAAQLVKMVQKHETEHVIFENGDAFAVADMIDLLGGDVQKLMALILSGEEEIGPETLEQDWSLVEPVVIPASELTKIKVEIRIVPMEMEDGSIVYEVSVWLRWDDQTLNISGMIPSLTVCLNADALVNEENFAKFTQLYTIAYQAPTDESTPDVLPGIVQLPSTLLLILDELPEHQADEAAQFKVTIDHEENETTVTYDADAHLVPYRHYALVADYAGSGYYVVIEVE